MKSGSGIRKRVICKNNRFIYVFTKPPKLPAVPIGEGAYAEPPVPVSKAITLQFGEEALGENFDFDVSDCSTEEELPKEEIAQTEKKKLVEETVVMPEIVPETPPVESVEVEEPETPEVVTAVAVAEPTFIDEDEECVYVYKEEAEVSVPKKVERKIYSVEAILGSSAREEVPVNLDFSIFSKRPPPPPAPPSKCKTCVDMYRMELNRVSWQNVNDVVDVVKHIKVIRAEDIIEMGHILYQKAISEKVYTEVYSYILHSLRDHPFQAVGADPQLFYKTVIKACQEALTNRESWTFNDAMDPNSTYQEKIKYTELADDAIYELTKVREKVFGSVKILVSLFKLGCVKYRLINILITDLVSDIENQESGELLVFLLNEIFAELEKNKKDQLEELVNVLVASCVSYMNKVKFKVFDLQERLIGKGVKTITLQNQVVDSTDFTPYCASIMKEMEEYEEEDYLEIFEEIITKNTTRAMPITSFLHSWLICLLEGKKSMFDKGILFIKNLFLTQGKNIKEPLPGILKSMEPKVANLLIDYPQAKSYWEIAKGQLLN